MARLDRSRRVRHLARGAAAAGAVAVLGLVAPPGAVAQDAAGAWVRVTGMTATCFDGGIDPSSSLELHVPAGSTVEQRWRVHRGDLSASLGSTTTPVGVALDRSAAVAEPHYFGPAWAHGFPFTFEVVSQVVVDGVVVQAQTVSATCTAAGPAAEITTVEADLAGPGTNADPTPADPTVVAPRFTG